MLIDTKTERHFEEVLMNLRAELAVPCAGDCANCPLNTEPEATPVVDEDK